MVLVCACLVSCSSSPATKGSDFIGNYPSQKIETVMINSVSEKKNELNPLEISYVLYPRKNTVEINMIYEMYHVTLTLSQTNRTEMLSSMQNYIDDYQAGKLGKENDRKKAFFGQTTIPMMWGLLSTSSYAKVPIYFEYRQISDKRPYFLFTCDMIPATDSNGAILKNGMVTPPLKLAFSPLQCQHVIEVLNQDALVKIVSDLDTEQSKFDIPEATASDEPNVMF